MLTGLVVLLVVGAVLLWPAAGADVVEDLAGPGRSGDPGPFGVRDRAGVLDRLGRRGGPGEEWVADLAEVVAVGLRAGLDLPTAVRTASSSPSVAAAAPWLGAALDDLGPGAPTSAVLSAAPTGRRPSSLEVLARAWRLSEATGASAAHTTAAAAAAVRARVAARHRLDVALAGPRASMRLLTLLPVLGPVAGLVLGLEPGRLYGPTPARIAVAAGLALTLLGWWWCAALVRRAVRPRTTAG